MVSTEPSTTQPHPEGATAERDEAAPLPEMAPGPDDGGGSGADGSLPRGYQPFSLRGPAVIVLGIAVFIVVAGVVGSILATGGAPPAIPRQVTLTDGTSVNLTPATTAMRSIVSLGQPPNDILGAMAVPTGSRYTHRVDADQGAAQYDRTVAFATGLSSDQVVDLYGALLPKLGWQVLYNGVPSAHGPTGTEVLAKKGSSDGYYWEAGIVVSPTTTSGKTAFSIELFELPDDES